MHWKTYDRLREELVALEEELAGLREAEKETLDKAFAALYADYKSAINILDELNERIGQRRSATH